MDIQTVTIPDNDWIHLRLNGKTTQVNLKEFINSLVYNAHIAGSKSTKGTGLNLSKEERAAAYCAQKGLSI